MEYDVPTRDYFEPLLAPPSDASSEDLRVYRITQQYVEFKRKDSSPGYSRSLLQKAIGKNRVKWDDPLGVRVRLFVKQFYDGKLDSPSQSLLTDEEILTHGKPGTGGGYRVIRSPRYA